METRTRERLRERERAIETAESSDGNGKSKKGIIIAVILLMLVANAVFIYFQVTKNDQELAEKELTIEQQKAELDKTKAELNAAITELEAKKDELAKLGADTMRIYNELQRVKSNLKNQSQGDSYKGAYMKLKKDLEDMRVMASQYEAEIRKLKNQVDTLQRVNTRLKDDLTAAQMEKQRAKEQSQAVASQVKEAKETIKQASGLKAENIQTFTLSAKGKEKEGGEYKVKDIDLLRISFLLPENKLAKTEGKEIILRIIEPDGGALFDLATGGGSFLFSGKEIFYTQKQDILYDKKSQQVTFDYKKGNPYKPGTYNIEVYAEGSKIGEHTFNVQ
jgi:cell division protein ZapB